MTHEDEKTTIYLILYIYISNKIYCCLFMLFFHAYIYAIILENLSSEEAKSGTSRKLRKIKTSQILVVFSKTY